VAERSKRRARNEVIVLDGARKGDVGLRLAELAERLGSRQPKPRVLLVQQSLEGVASLG
jgi:hypothetical protein